MSQTIQTADLDWHIVDGIEIPVSRQFGDVYFSKDNGLLETRHVFLNGNDLPDKLSQLPPFGYFCVGETGFGTGLNILALWQLWQQVKPDNHSHLHAISVEKFPLKKADLIRALQAWPELKELADLLIEQYPSAVGGCHRLNFPEHRFSLDLWLGDAHDVFPQIVKTATVNAWFLDGFAPACNPDMWQENVLNHIVRLSDPGSSFASFSVAGVLKRGLRQHGIHITRPRGFGHKREMLKAWWPQPESVPSDQNADSSMATAIPQHTVSNAVLVSHQSRPRQIAIIGAGIAGLSCAWALAQRGHFVRIYDQSGPLSGASGNPLALLNPKLAPAETAPDHLMTMSWQYAMRHYPRFNAFRPLAIHQILLKKPEDQFALVAQYPEGLLTTVPTALLSDMPQMTLTQAGAVQPHVLKDEILAHSHIQWVQAQISKIETLDDGQIQLHSADLQPDDLDKHFDQVVVCAARNSAQFFQYYPVLRPIRGQVSWLNNSNSAQKPDLHEAYSYGGYCMQLDARQLILGASFLPDNEDTTVTEHDHQHNHDLIDKVFPDYARTLPPITQWQGRASLRAQSQDYFPVLGKSVNHQEVYSFAGLGSKGFLFAPLCAEILVALILRHACPVPQKLLEKLNPQRGQKKVRTPKPYFQATTEKQAKS